MFPWYNRFLFWVSNDFKLSSGPGRNTVVVCEPKCCRVWRRRPQGRGHLPTGRGGGLEKVPFVVGGVKHRPESVFPDTNHHWAFSHFLSRILPQLPERFGGEPFSPGDEGCGSVRSPCSAVGCRGPEPRLISQQDPPVSPVGRACEGRGSWPTWAGKRDTALLDPLGLMLMGVCPSTHPETFWQSGELKVWELPAQGWSSSGFNLLVVQTVKSCPTLQAHGL